MFSNNQDSLAIYVANWNDENIQKYGTVPGCLQAEKYNNFKREIC